MLGQDEPSAPAGSGQRPDMEADEHRMSVHHLGAPRSGVLDALVQAQGASRYGPGGGAVAGKNALGDDRHAAAHDGDPVLLARLQRRDTGWSAMTPTRIPARRSICACSRKKEPLWGDRASGYQEGVRTTCICNQAFLGSVGFRARLRRLAPAPVVVG